jgi:hypothetical protein
MNFIFILDKYLHINNYIYAHAYTQIHQNIKFMLYLFNQNSIS